RSLAEYREWAKDELRPVLRRILDIAIREDILVPQAAYGYWPCAAEGNDVIIFDTDGNRELTRLSFPRQNKDGGLCIADFFGYPACPNLADQQQLLALLRAEEIGITLSEEDQLDPEQSTSAIVLHHPQAKYFSV